MNAVAPPVLLTAAARWNRARQALLVAILMLIATVIDPDRPLPTEVCLWNRVTGWPCPTCGLTRALCHAMRGEWAASLRFHPAGVLVVVGLAGWALWSACEAWRGQPILQAARRSSFRILLSIGAAVSLASWIARIVMRTSL